VLAAVLQECLAVSRQGEALEKHVKSIFGKLGLVKIDRFGSILRGL
jgi:hypothetical protein